MWPKFRSRNVRSAASAYSKTLKETTELTEMFTKQRGTTTNPVFRIDTNLLTEVAHSDHSLQLTTAPLCPGEEVSQARFEGADHGPEHLSLRVWRWALDLLCLCHQDHSLVLLLLKDSNRQIKPFPLVQEDSNETSVKQCQHLAVVWWRENEWRKPDLHWLQRGML